MILIYLSQNQLNELRDLTLLMQYTKVLMRHRYISYGLPYECILYMFIYKSDSRTQLFSLHHRHCAKHKQSVFCVVDAFVTHSLKIAYHGVIYFEYLISRKLLYFMWEYIFKYIALFQFITKKYSLSYVNVMISYGYKTTFVNKIDMIDMKCRTVKSLAIEGQCKCQ